MNQLNKVFQFLRLTHEQEDSTIIQEAIEKGVVVRGTNVWILVFAILIASVGLNMNSTAVIIGAMLISPLMGPINGIGYSVATYNFALFRKSIKNFGYSTLAALVTSTVYFLLTPISTEHAELLARTSPTIYDVLIALFGGLAGIVAISSKNKGNVIPGVAIATALMPPLCTAGFGLSMGNSSYFFGALYLFTINSVFIALSAMIVSQLLKFPKQKHLLSKEIKNKNIAIGFVIAVTVIPSFYLGYTLVAKEKFKSKAEKFVDKIAIWEGNFLLGNKINANEKTIELIYGGNEFTDKTEERLVEKANDLGLSDAIITVKQGLKIKDYESMIQRNDNDNNKYSQLTAEINRLRNELDRSNFKSDSLAIIPGTGDLLLREIQSLFPVIESCAYSLTKQYNSKSENPEIVAMVFFNASETISENDRNKIRTWLENRLRTKSLILKF
jgi:uncharacterized hydrophobic protein (TIGR00271 family)